jgi:hypothetical protein
MATTDAVHASVTGKPSAGALRRMRMLFLLGIGLDLGLIGLQVALYPALLAQPGSLGYIAEPIVMVLVYAAIVVAVTTRVAPADQPARQATLSLGMAFGLLTGGLWIVNHTLETFVDLSSLGILATAPLLLGAFLLWDLAGFLRAQQTGSLPSGLLAALWSAMLCVLLTITDGFALLYLALPRLTAREANDPDFARSHWSDLHAFVIANTFDAAFSHLLGAIVISLVFGAVGSLMGLLINRMQRARALERPPHISGAGRVL